MTEIDFEQLITGEGLNGRKLQNVLQNTRLSTWIEFVFLKY
jgi:hypothetical protein